MRRVGFMTWISLYCASFPMFYRRLLGYLFLILSAASQLFHIPSFLRNRRIIHAMIPRSANGMYSILPRLLCIPGSLAQAVHLSLARLSRCATCSSIVLARRFVSMSRTSFHSPALCLPSSRLPPRYASRTAGPQCPCGALPECCIAGLAGLFEGLECPIHPPQWVLTAPVP